MSSSSVISSDLISRTRNCIPDDESAERKDVSAKVVMFFMSYNLLSVSKITDTGKTTNFDDVHCHITDESGKLLAMAMKVGSLYYLDYQEITECHLANTVETKEPESKESIWHRQFGHLGVITLQKLARDSMIKFRLRCVK